MTGGEAVKTNWDKALEPALETASKTTVNTLGQDVKYESHHVEIDRCGKCGGIWLDKGESDPIMKIGDKLQPLLDAEKAKAQEELDKMGDVDFGSPGLIARFLGLFKKKA